MKRQIFLIIVVIISIRSYAQNNQSDITDAYLLNFSVPDMPAFKALGTDPSNILRPSDVQKFAAMLSPFYSEGKGVVPKNFALEASPGKLASSNWHLSEYKGLKKFWYNSAFSAGTLGDSANFASKLSIGFRTSFVSRKGDILNAIQDDLTYIQSQQNFHLLYTELENKYRNPATKYDTQFVRFDDFIVAINKNISSFSKDTVLFNIWKQIKEKIGGNIPDSINTEEKFLALYKTNVTDAFIEKWKKDNWNATRFDVAIAWVGESSDSLIKNSGFSSFNTWATLALKVGAGSQLLLGTSLILPRSLSKDTTYSNWTANLRLYVGNSNVRGFLETQYRNRNYGDYDKALLLNLGAEFRVGKDFWVQATAGVNNYLNDVNPFSKLVSSLDLRYAFNK